MSTLKKMVTDELEFIRTLYENGGELTPEMATALELRENALPEKIDGYAHKIERLEAEIALWSEKQKQVNQIVKSLKTTQDWLKKNIKDSMLDLNKKHFDGHDYQFTLSHSAPSVEIDEDKIPAKYIVEKITYQPDKKLVKKALESGETVDGARLKEVYRLSCKLNRGDG